jgi:hypothetical protein
VIAEPQPPCIGCGSNPPPGTTWDVVEYAVQEGEKYVPWTRCPSCSEIGQSGIPSPRDRDQGVDDITHARDRIGVLAGTYPRLHFQLDAIIARIEKCFTPVPTPPGVYTDGREMMAEMPEDWALPVSEVLRLVSTVLCDNRLVALAKAVDALVERGFTGRAFAVLTTADIASSFGTTRVPVSARELIGVDAPSADPLPGVAAGPPGEWAVVGDGDGDRD